MNTKQIKGKIENLPSDGKTSMEFLVKHLTLLYGYNKVSTDYISDADGNLGRSVKLFKNDIAYLVKIINRNSYLEYSIGVTEETQKANAKMDAAREIKTLISPIWGIASAVTSSGSLELDIIENSIKKLIDGIASKNNITTDEILITLL